jgi:hypothetical protein
VSGAAGNFGGRHPGVQPQRHRRVPQGLGRRPELGGVEDLIDIMT